MRFTLNRRGVRELLLSPEVRTELEIRARWVQASAGPGHRIEVSGGAGRGKGGKFVGGKRIRVAVITDTTEARRREASTRSLTRALNAARR